MKRIFLLLFIFILTGCSDSTTIDYYLNQGYTDMGVSEYGYNTANEDGTEKNTMRFLF